MFPKLKKIVLQSGAVIDVSDGVTCIVGPNNSGKSLVLRELNSALQAHPGNPRESFMALQDPYLEYPEGGAEVFIQQLAGIYQHRPPGVYPQGTIGNSHFRLPNNATLPDTQIQQVWGNEHRLGGLHQVVLLYLNAESRLGMASNAGGFNQFKEEPATPVQHLYVHRKMEAEFSALMKWAFGVPLTVNRYAGNEITLHIGSVEAEEVAPPPSAEYLAELSTLPQVAQQGDGIRAFVGMLLAITTAQYPLVIIDEPEAFLHPPQAYLLGQILAEQHARNTQVVVATHSEELVQGMTSVKDAAGKVTIARLTRDGTRNHVAQVSTTTIRELYEDPLIRYYRILDGLFYQGVVLCEADSDCTYYRAVLDAVKQLEDGTPTSAISLYFTHCGGKARLARAVDALRSAKVPVAVAVDFDFLRDDKEFNELVAACGSDIAALTPRRNDVTSAIAVKARKVDRAVARLKLNELLDKRTTAELNSGELGQASKILKPSTGWDDAKKQGRGSLSGQAVESFDTLNMELQKLGIFIVEVGELERFHPEVPADNKAEWLRQVLEAEKHATSDQAAKYVAKIASSINAQQ